MGRTGFNAGGEWPKGFSLSSARFRLAAAWDRYRSKLVTTDSCRVAQMLSQCIHQTVALIAHDSGAREDLVMDRCSSKSLRKESTILARATNGIANAAGSSFTALRKARRGWNADIHCKQVCISGEAPEACSKTAFTKPEVPFLGHKADSLLDHSLPAAETFLEYTRHS